MMRLSDKPINILFVACRRTSLRYADHGLDLYSSAPFARAAFLQSNADAVRRFARAFNEALQLSIAQPEVESTCE